MAEDDSPELASVIAAAIEARLVDVHTSLPGRVESYDAARQVADIKPMLRRVIRRENMERVVEELPVIPCVPVQWSRGGGAFVSLPLAAGDFGWLMFADYSIDRFRSTGDDVDPGDTRRFDLSNAVFLPNGPFPSDEALADANASEIRVGFDGDYQAAIKKGPSPEIRLPADATTFLARADRVLTELQGVATAFNGHTHTAGGYMDSSPAPVTGVSGGPSSSYSASDPASDTVKGT